MLDLKQVSADFKLEIFQSMFLITVDLSANFTTVLRNP